MSFNFLFKPTPVLLRLFSRIPVCCFQKNSIHPAAKRHTDKVKYYLANILEHLAAKEAGVSQGVGAERDRSRTLRFTFTASSEKQKNHFFTNLLFLNNLKNVMSLFSAFVWLQSKIINQYWCSSHKKWLENCNLESLINDQNRKQAKY